MQECQAIKNATKKAECYDRLTQKSLRDEEERVKREALEKADAQGQQAKADRAAAEKAKVIDASKNVLKALRKLENRLEAGVSYKEYPALYSEASFELKEYISSEFGKVVPNFSSLCQEAIDSYSDAQALWRQRIQDSNKYDSDVIYSNFSLTDYIVDKYHVGANLSGRALRPASSVMKVIWNNASKKTAEAESSLLLWMNAPK